MACCVARCSMKKHVIGTGEGDALVCRHRRVTLAEAGLGSGNQLRHIKRHYRPAKTLQLHVPKLFEPRYRLDRASNAAADQDLLVLCLGAQP